jgi:hypothetical protein
MKCEGELDETKVSYEIFNESYKKAEQEYILKMNDLEEIN